MILKWKNATAEPLRIYIDTFGGKPTYVIYCGYDLDINLPDEDEEYNITYDIHYQNRNKVAIISVKKKKPKPKA